MTKLISVFNLVNSSKAAYNMDMYLISKFNISCISQLSLIQCRISNRNLLSSSVLHNLFFWKQDVLTLLEILNIVIKKGMWVVVFSLVPPIICCHQEVEFPRSKITNSFSQNGDTHSNSFNNLGQSILHLLIWCKLSCWLPCCDHYCIRSYLSRRS